jgi:hypothetical protein
VIIDRPFFSQPLRETVRLKVEAPYAASNGMFSASALLVGGGWPTWLRSQQGEESPILDLRVRSSDPFATPSHQNTHTTTQDITLASDPLHSASHLALEDLRLVVWPKELGCDRQAVGYDVGGALLNDCEVLK